MWLVIFLDGPLLGPLHRLTSSPNYRHVSAISYLPGPKTWLIADPNRHRLNIEPISPSYATFLIDRGLKEGGIIEFQAKNANRATILPLQTCVTIIKALLGVRSLAITPYQLYKRLLTEGKLLGDGHGRPENAEGEP